MCYTHEAWEHKGGNGWLDKIGRLTGWEEVSSVLGIILSTIDFSYKPVGVSHRFEEPGRVRCDFVVRCGVGARFVPRVIASGVHRGLRHARLDNRWIQGVGRGW